MPTKRFVVSARGECFMSDRGYTAKDVNGFAVPSSYTIRENVKILGVLLLILLANKHNANIVANNRMSFLK